MEPQYKKLLALRVSRDELRAAYRQIEAFRRSRLPLGDELAQLQLCVPAEIQFTLLRFNQFAGNPKTDAASSRTYEMHITGKVIGDDPKESVVDLKNCLSAPAYTNRVESVTVPNNGFHKVTSRVLATGETRTDWFFELVCRYRPRSFE